MAQDAEKAVRNLGAGFAQRRSVVLMSDRPDGADVLGLSDALRPLVELCLAPEAETPFALGLVGRRGVGKRDALRRLVEGIDSLSRGAPRSAASTFLSKVVVVRIDAASAGDDPASAIAAATFRALETAQYAQLADDAAHATVDPRSAAATAAEVHDAAVRRLEQERAARSDVEGKRARIAEALLFETPGARIDSFIRASRGKIEAKLRHFGFAEGDAGANFRNLVRDMSSIGAASRPAIFLRATWAYRGQAGLVVLAILAFALAFGLDRLRNPGVVEQLTSLSAQLAPVLDAATAHSEQVEYAIEALIVLGFGALFANLWRAASFTGLLFRGLRLLNLDIREQRRELDASAARLERRVAALQIEADAANQRVETLARRAGGGASPSTRPPGPQFVKSSEAPALGAREFMHELVRLLNAGAVPGPQRLFIVIENVDQGPPAESRRLLDVAVQLAGRNMAVIAACDPSRWPGDAREIVESLFQIVFDVGAIGSASGEALAARLLTTSPAPAVLFGDAGIGPLALSEPLDEAEIRMLTSVSALIGPNPSALKRLFNAYRLARLGDVSRPLVALALAARMARDPDFAPALRWAFFNEGDTLAPPAGPPSLATAYEAVVLPSTDKATAQRAWALARRYAPWPD